MVKFLQMFIKCTNVALAHNLKIESMLIHPPNLGYRNNKNKQNGLKRNKNKESES